MSARIHDGELTHSVDLAADLPVLNADERKTKQVFLNLVTNAVKYTPPGGHIEIAGRFDRERGVIFTISDSGIGIAPEHLERVLQPFEQSIRNSADRSPAPGSVCRWSRPSWSCTAASWN